MSKLANFLRKVASHAVISHALASKAAEDIALTDLQKKAAMDEIEPTIDALVSIGVVKPEQRKLAAASLASHADALVKLRKLAEMVKAANDKTAVGGPGAAMPKRAGDAVPFRSAREMADEEFASALQ